MFPSFLDEGTNKATTTEKAIGLNTRDKCHVDHFLVRLFTTESETTIEGRRIEKCEGNCKGKGKGYGCVCGASWSSTAVQHQLRLKLLGSEGIHSCVIVIVYDSAWEK